MDDTVYLVEDAHGLNTVVVFAERKDADEYVARGLGYALPMHYRISPFKVWASLAEMDEYAERMSE